MPTALLERELEERLMTGPLPERQPYDSRRPDQLKELRDGDLIHFSGRAPVYVDPSLKKPAMNIMSRLNQFVYDKYGIALPYGYLQIRKGRLPYILEKEKDGSFVWKKILGQYNLLTNEIIIDENLEHGEVMRTLGHELVHYAQHALGGLDRYVNKYGDKAREYIEMATDYFNEGFLRGKYPTSDEKLEKALTAA